MILKELISRGTRAGGVLLLLGAAAVLLITGCSGPQYIPGKLAEKAEQERRPAASTGALSLKETSGYLQVEPEIRLYYEARGDGPETALVLHGGPGYPHQDTWKGLAPFTDNYRFIYYHQRGCGNSTRPVSEFTSKNYYKNMTALVDKLGLEAQLLDIERIRRLLGQEKITLIGHSFGGFLAALYAAEFPMNVEKLLLIAPAEVVTMDTSSGGLYDHIANLLPEPEQKNYEDFLKRFFDYKKLFEKTEEELAALNLEFIGFYESAGKAYASKKGEGEGEAMQEESLYTTKEMGGFMMHGIFFSMGRKHDYSDILKRITCPVLILSGDEDFGVSLETIKKSYHENIRSSEFKIVTGTSHFMVNEAPDAFAKATGPFLAE